ncbi:MAG: hypothetical protein Q7T19_05045 [Caulobacter sp.]|nr:hypothetical protein [Caulobacter sp.]
MEKPWFSSKRFGYGARLPCSWEGWLVVVAYLAIVFASAVTMTEGNEKLHFVIILFASVAFVVICARTTRGGWRWRWGQD